MTAGMKNKYKNYNFIDNRNCFMKNEGKIYEQKIL